MANEEWVFAERPEPALHLGTIRLRDCAAVSESDMEDGDVIIALTYVSVDPYMRGLMNQTKLYFDLYAIDAPMNGGCTGVVQASRNVNFNAGDNVTGVLEWRRISLIKGGAGLQKLNPAIPPSLAVGALGITGLSALLSLEKIGEPKAGETIFISGAAGAVGSVVGQIAKAKGLRVIGSAGEDAKVDVLLSMGFDGAFNYKTCNTAEKLRELCPDGLDIYFDNVGGATLETALNQMRDFGRVVLCGMISQYNIDKEDMYGVKNLLTCVWKRIKMQGFIITDWFADFPAAIGRLSEYYAQGVLKPQETVVEGFGCINEALVGLFAGNNTGKMVVRI